MIDFDRLAAWMDDQGLAGKGEPLEHAFVVRRLAERDLRDPPRRPPRRDPHPAADRAGRPRRGHPPRVAHHRGARRHRRAAHRGHRRVRGPVGARPHLLPDGLRRRLVADETPTAWPAPFDTDLDARKGLAYQLVEGIALLGNVDWQAKGLQDLGRPDGFHERQVDRWTAFLERIKGRELPGFDEASAWLRAHRADRLRPRAHARRLPVRQRDVPGRRAGAARRASSTGRWARSATRSSTSAGSCRAGPTTPMAVEAASRGYVDMYGMPSRDEVLAALRRRCRAARSTTSTTTSSSPSGSSRSCSSRASSARGDDEKLAGVRPDRARPHAGRGRPRRVERLRRHREPLAVRAAYVPGHGPPEVGRGAGAARPRCRDRARCSSTSRTRRSTSPTCCIVNNEYQVQVPAPFVPGSEFAGVDRRGRRRRRRSGASRSATTSTAPASWARTPSRSSCTRRACT